MDRRLLRIALGAALVLALVAGVLALVDLSAATSATDTESQVSVGRTNDSDAGPGDRLYLYVRGEEARHATVGDAIAAALEDRGVAVTRVDSLAESYDGPVLVVWFEDWRVDWAAVTASADLRWGVAYSSVGNTTSLVHLMEGGTGVVLSAGNPYVLWGDFHLVDRTTGLVSWPAYRGHVASAVAEATVEQLLQRTRG
jgi:hypothetical protein